MPSETLQHVIAALRAELFFAISQRDRKRAHNVRKRLQAAQMRAKTGLSVAECKAFYGIKDAEAS